MGILFYIKYILLVLLAPKSRLRLEYGMLRLLNRERRNHGLGILFHQKDLRRVARKHSSDMAKKEYFAHENLDRKSPKDRFVDNRISEYIAGENLAKVQGYNNPLEVAHDGLMKSAGHRKNILSPVYNCVGIGVARGLNGTIYFTQNFSKRVLIISGYPSILRFRSNFKVDVRISDSSISNILVIVAKDGKRIYERPKRVALNGVYRFHFTLPEKGKYEVQIFAGKSTLSLANHFKITRHRFLW